jgi:hypothetical protein
MDEFLRPNSTFLRLLSDWKKYGNISVGFDFDQTVAPFHNKEAKYDMVINLLWDLDRIGASLVCWTANPNHEYVDKYLKDRGINHVGINIETIPLGYETRKPFYNALLDDRAGLESVYRDLHLLVWYVREHGLAKLKEEL